MIDEFLKNQWKTPYSLRPGNHGRGKLHCGHEVLARGARRPGIFSRIAVIAEVYTQRLREGEAQILANPAPATRPTLKTRLIAPRRAFRKIWPFWERSPRPPARKTAAARLGAARYAGRQPSSKVCALRKSLARDLGAHGGHKVSPAVFFTGIYALIVAFMSGERILALAPVGYGSTQVLYRRQERH